MFDFESRESEIRREASVIEDPEKRSKLQIYRQEQRRNSRANLGKRVNVVLPEEYTMDE